MLVKFLFKKTFKKKKHWVYLLDSYLSLFAMNSSHLFKEKKKKTENLTLFFSLCTSKKGFFFFLGQKFGNKMQEKI
jgi:hypothetical protein